MSEGMPLSFQSRPLSVMGCKTYYLLFSFAFKFFLVGFFLNSPWYLPGLSFLFKALLWCSTYFFAESSFFPGFQDLNIVISPGKKVVVSKMICEPIRLITLDLVRRFLSVL
jgi:hypothetical protein